MNKLHLIAAAAAVAASSAQALTPAQVDLARSAGTLKEIRIAGASALRLSIAAYMKEICANDVHVFWDNANSGNDHRAYSCTLGVATGNYGVGTPVLVYKRDAGGSGQGVTPIGTAALQQHLVVDGSSCSVVVNAAPSTDPSVANYRCTVLSSTTAGDPTAVVSDAGISDVEPSLLNATVNTAAPLTAAQLQALNSGSLVQSLFGIAVNKKAYRALQEAQGIIAPGGQMVDVPADQATWTTATLATIPSLPREFIAAAMTQLVSGGAANKRGWNVVIPDTPYSLDGGVTVRPAVDAISATKTVNVCRRSRGSGTQAAAQAYFLQNPCNSGPAAYAPSGSVTANATTTSATVIGASVFQSGGSSGEVEDCLGTDVDVVSGGADNTAYGLGLLGRENNPRRANGDKGYRFVKIDGVAPVRNEAKSGNYGFVYEATMQWNNTTLAGQTDKIAFLTALRNGFGRPSALAAVDSDTQQGVMSPPATYTGTYADATGANALFGSRVARLPGNSCAPLRITK